MSRLTLKYSKELLILGFLVVLICPTAVCLAQSGQASGSDTLNLCFLSDTQEPMLFERAVLAYNDNAKARGLIFEMILELNPNAVVHLGDQVSLGTSSGNWEEVDQFVGRLHKQGIEFCPIPGNHEYLLTSKKGMSNFEFRYPDAKLNGYSRRFGNVAVVLVNSNFGELSDKEKGEQLHWYRQTLADFETDTTVGFVIVGCHHPPFTNSKIVGVSEEIRESYLPEFYKSGKCKLFVSGHAHAFEHFNQNGKDFLVIGGGGGLQHPLSIGENAEYHDLFSDSLEKRMFHFITVTSRDDTLAVELKMLKEDFGGFESFPQLKFVHEKSIERESRPASQK